MPFILTTVIPRLLIASFCGLRKESWNTKSLPKNHYYNKSDAGRYFRAVQAGMDDDYEPMEKVFTGVIERAGLLRSPYSRPSLPSF
jgi:hypothetical protein